IQVGSGLAAAHAAGIIHRDVKPENIMRRGDNLVKVLDFGIAKPMEQETLSFSARGDHQDSHTEAGMVLGTVGYMSPEQARGLKVDERTDVWSLGVVLYEMLAGYPPFAAATRMDTLVRILEREPQPLQSATVTPPCLEKLQRIIDRSLCKESEERYQTVAAMLADLRALKHELERVAILNAEAGGASLNIAGPLFRKASGRYLPDVNTRPHHQKPTTHHGSRQRLYLLAVLIPLSLALLAVLYFKRSGEVSTGTPAANAKLYKQMSDAERIAFIDEQEQRISALMGDRPVKLNVDALQAIKQRVDQYLARTGVAHEPGKERLQDIYQRATPHVPLIARSFEARKVPATIGIYLPMIESEYVPCFENSIGAKGLFQFLPSTARQYGVASSEMCDVEKMTPAAAHYIADRMAELGEDSQSMTLVLLSYNRGAEWVRDTLRDLRSSENFHRNFWTLLDHRDQLDDTFRNENAGYVPMFFAAAIIGENPRTFELTIPPLSSLAGTSASKK
ncbi:MAG: protein kinase domain-containing protein, partial [Pyrinomonadaceae bacterium]